MDRLGRQIAFLAFVCTLLSQSALNGQVQELAKAQRLLLRGNYQESLEAYSQLQDRFPEQAALGGARCLSQQGEYAQAAQRLEQQLKLSPQSTPLLAERAELAQRSGDLETATRLLQQALSVDKQHIQARWLQAELWRIQGKLSQASKAYRWLAEYYDQKKQAIQSPYELIWLGQGIAQHARFNRDGRRFKQLTEQLYPRVLELEPNFWPAHYHVGLLLAEKFNAADASAALSDAIAINPQTADIQVGLARLMLEKFELHKASRHLQRALKTNPHHAGALRCQADIDFASLRPQQALAPLEQALQLNPMSAQTLGRLAATHAQLTTPADQSHAQALDQLVAEVTARHPHAGEFYLAWGRSLELARRFPLAGIRFRQAIEKMPKLVGPRGQLGMIEMRLGHEAEARRWLEESFQIDPYNVRVKNQLEVLDLLDEYATLETEHFVIRYDSAHDKALAQYIAQHAELCYRELSIFFDFKLTEKGLIEIFQNSRGVSARQWFGARMVGLPNIHTIAACSGNVLAMVSPTSERRRLNWADILRHELVHLINIQQTKYAVPHWLTEGCAVWQEGRRRSPRWEKLLLKRVPQGDMFDLNTINLGFLRPRSAEDWQLAYCQAEIYVTVILEKFGENGLRRLLASFRDNTPPHLVFEQALGASQQEIEDLYAEHLRNVMSGLEARRGPHEKVDVAEAMLQYQAKPDDAQLGAKLAQARLQQGDYPGAGRLVEKVLQVHPQQPLARLVKARILLRIGDEKPATEILKGLTMQAQPDPQTLTLLAGIYLRKEEFALAKQLYLQGAKHQPDSLQWTKALAVVALKEKDNRSLAELLEQVAAAEPDNLLARRKCLELAQDRNDAAEIRRWSTEVLHIDPRDIEASQALQLN